ncbi:trypsin-like [Copidosoma floridanum]|uniref:trypsin-like n=1 Tax=Copidosoma floridanum TaxID=29053 RepID=UPI0006C98BAE|nr:trypsin-like [Copidosoma floridanum]
MLQYKLLLFCFALITQSIVWTSAQDDTHFEDYDVPSDIGTEEPKEVPKRIVNGTKAILGQFPQQVSLRRRYSQSHFCGGSIITPGWILTASHCMFDRSGKILEPYSVIIVAGDVILKSIKLSYQWRGVKRIIIHPHFNSYTLENDVSLLQLKKPFTFDPLVNAAPLARTFVRSGTVCQVSGWGYQKHEDGIVSQHLLYVDLPLISVPLCRKLLWNISNVPVGMYCAGYKGGGRDACQGDSGGGMLCMGRLTGVVSGGEGCAWPDRPGLYSDIKVFLPWIEQFVDLNEKHPMQLHPIKRVNANSAIRLPPSFRGILAASVFYLIYYI